MGIVTPSPAERARPLPGDDLVRDPDVVMDRGADLPAPPEVVWPWLVQLGKRRAGWYLRASVERLVPPSRRALRHVDPHWQGLAVGDVIPDWGGAEETFTVEQLRAPDLIVYSSRRGGATVSWVLALSPTARGSRLHLRLRVGPVKHPRLVGTVGEAFDWLTVRGMVNGLSERLGDGEAPLATGADERG